MIFNPRIAWKLSTRAVSRIFSNLFAWIVIRDIQQQDKPNKKLDPTTRFMMGWKGGRPPK